MAKVLVVDDDPDILELVQIRLRSAGHITAGASDGPSALALAIEKGAPDVAVLDVSMPGMTGLELLDALRSQTGDPELPAVFLSAKVQPDDVDAGRAMGATYLTKPFIASALLNAVEKSVRPTAGGGPW